jgi:hypothetical protein
MLISVQNIGVITGSRDLYMQKPAPGRNQLLLRKPVA